MGDLADIDEIKEWTLDNVSIGLFCHPLSEGGTGDWSYGLRLGGF